MMRPRSLVSRFTLVLVALTVLFLLAFPRAAAAQNAKVEASAKALQKKAMEEDYLATDFAKAKDKLDKAINACGADKCSAPTRALLKRDLGTVLVGGAIDKDAGVAAFAEAMKIDPNVALDKDTKTKEIEAAWNEAKKGGGGGGTPAAPSGPAPVGDFVHTPVPVQQYRTPVPIYVEYAGTEKLVKVIARYRGLGMTEWKPVELKKTGESGWGGLVPCADVQVGALSYFVQGFNAENDPVAIAGDRNNAYKVSIQREAIQGEPPHLPEQAPPKQCQDTGDCPPNFPGCKQPKKGETKGDEEPDGKDEGEECEDDGECKSRSCEKVKGESTRTCGSDAARKMPRIWVGGMLSFDFTMIPSQDDVCKLHPRDANDKDTSAGGFPLNDVGYYCTADGSDYPTPRPAPNATASSETNEGNGAITLGKSNKVTGGAAPSNLRILATFDYAVNTNILVGARAGIVLITYPGEYAVQDGKRSALTPFHLELRGTYVFGKDPLAKKGLAPYAFFGAGLSTWETKVPVTVIETTKGSRSVDAWHITGPGFIGIGGGIRYAFTPTAAFMGGLRAAFAFGNAFVPSFAPEVGMQFGF